MCGNHRSCGFRLGQGRAGQGRPGQGRAGQGRNFGKEFRYRVCEFKLRLDRLKSSGFVEIGGQVVG